MNGMPRSCERLTLCVIRCVRSCQPLTCTSAFQVLGPSTTLRMHRWTVCSRACPVLRSLLCLILLQVVVGLLYATLHTFRCTTADHGTYGYDTSGRALTCNDRSSSPLHLRDIVWVRSRPFEPFFVCRAHAVSIPAVNNAVWRPRWYSRRACTWAIVFVVAGGMYIPRAIHSSL